MPFTIGIQTPWQKGKNIQTWAPKRGVNDVTFGTNQNKVFCNSLIL